MDPSAEQLARDFPGWRIEHSGAGTTYWSAHQGTGDEARHLGSPTAAGLRRMLDLEREGGTVADLGAKFSQAGF